MSKKSNREIREERQRGNKRGSKKGNAFIPCRHSYAYCYYNHKERENVYRCVECGKWLYV